MTKRLGGVPVRLDPCASDPRRRRHEPHSPTRAASTRTRYFVLNASLGVVAQGNAFFNAPDKTLRALKKTSVDLAIAYAAVVSITRFTPITLNMSLDDQPLQPVQLTAMGILKQVYFAGGMHYDTPVAADDGMFAVNVWEPMGRWSIVALILALYRGQFTGASTRRHIARGGFASAPDRRSISSSMAKSRRSPQADVEVVPRAVRLCG